MSESVVREIVLAGQSTVGVKKLLGFEAHHSVPRINDSYHNAWIGKIAVRDMEAELDGLAKSVRLHMGSKRRDIQGGVDGNTGVLEAPGFVYRLTVCLDADKLNRTVWVRELTPGEEPGALLRSPEINDLFPDSFNALSLRFSRPLDVPAVIDAWEDRGLDVDYPLDASRCELPVGDDGVQIKVTQDDARIHFPDNQPPLVLVSSYDELTSDEFRGGLPHLI
ncbi:MAG: hypothetical protein COA73_11255 [Candidatus Hydrogenedentota bacterium]|nr:MAG: hypothetical protein COA73_11255 [Candidatus Hydrogenedentota bacterium]